MGIAVTSANADSRVLTVGTAGNYQYRTISEVVAKSDADSNSDGEEGLPFGKNSLSISKNIFTNTAPNATGIYDPKCVPIQLADNAFQGTATPVEPIGCAVKK